MSITITIIIDGEQASTTAVSTQPETDEFSSDSPSRSGASSWMDAGAAPIEATFGTGTEGIDARLDLQGTGREIQDTAAGAAPNAPELLGLVGLPEAPVAETESLGDISGIMAAGAAPTFPPHDEHHS
jgi:hypothetical protein